MRQPRPPSTAAHAKRIRHLAAAIDAYRRGNPRRRLPRGLRAQVVAAIDAGAPVQAVREACELSAWQVTRWLATAAQSARDAAPKSSAAPASPRVLSVVDTGPREDSRLGSEIELRIGDWYVSLRRIMD